MSGVLIFDLETSALEGNRGHILCAAAKWYGEEWLYTWRIDDATKYGTTPKSWRNDADIVRDLVKLATEATAVVAYYGGYGKFDVPFLNTRALAHGIQPCPQLSIIDPYTTAKGKLRLARNNMDAVATLLKCDRRKYHLPWEAWQNAKYGDRAAMNELLSYCENDVLVLEEVYTKLLPLMNNHPYVIGGADLPNPEHRDKQCPVCGSVSTISKGKRYTKVYEVYRRQCKKCKHNFQSGKKKVSV